MTNQANTFNQKLHLIYLVNDDLHYCIMKNADALQTALEGGAVPMYYSEAKVATDDEIGNLTKVLTFWKSKNRFFSDQTLKDMKSSRNIMT